MFRAVLRLCPAAFRDRFGGELLDTAGALDRTCPVRPSEWPGVMLDAARTVHHVRREMRHEAAAPGAGFRRMLMRALFDGLWQDIRLSARGLRRDTAFTTFVVAALMLGIGANAAMFGIVDRLLLSGPPHIHEASRVVRFYLTAQPPGMRVFTTDGFGQVASDMARSGAASFEAIGSYSIERESVLGEGADARAVRTGFASASLFPLLGVQPVAGRFFTAQEDAPTGGEPVAVLSYGAWQAWFGGANDALGRPVILGGRRYAVVGVAPRGFTGPQVEPVDLWLPMNTLSPRVTPDWQTTWNAQWMQIVGRLKPGVTMAQASEDLTGVLRRSYAGDEPYVAQGRMLVASLSTNDRGVEAPEVTVVRWLFGVTLIVLVIACANVANLMLARGVRRSREVALRSALGARTGRIVRLLFVEALWLAGAGAAGGIAVAYGLGQMARQLIFSWVDWSTPPIDGRVLGASAVLAVVTGLVVGVLPALRAVRSNLADALKRSTRDGGGQRSRARHALTVVQAALSVVLLIGAGLFVRSLWNVSTLPLGMDADRVLVLDLSRPPLGQIADPAAKAAERTRRALTDLELIGDMQRLSGVEHAAAAVGLPFGNRFTIDLRIPGMAAVPRLKTGAPSVSAVTAGYFATMGTRILRGRAFEPTDRAGTEPVAIVNETMASTVWPGEDPIGKCFYVGTKSTACARIVGVAEATHETAINEPPVMHYYIPFGQEVGFGGTVLLVRGGRDPMAIGPAVRRAILDRDPGVRFVTTSTVQEAIDPQTKQWRVGTTVFLLAGVLALVVAGVGIYSVLSYLVAERTREIGVRLALGARQADVAGLILRGSVGMAGLGAVAGCIAALFASPLVEPLLFNESARDPVVYVAASLTIVGVALASGVVPTIRAGRISPLTALGAE